MTDKFAD